MNEACGSQNKPKVVLQREVAKQKDIFGRHQNCNKYKMWQQARVLLLQMALPKSELSEDILPFLKHKPLKNDLTADGITLWWVPDLYNCCSGHMRHTQDIPLVKNWYLEHCPPNKVVKDQVLYQKLLNCFILNELRLWPEMAMTKKNLFRQLNVTKFFQTMKLDWVRWDFRSAGRSITCWTSWFIARCVTDIQKVFWLFTTICQNLNYLYSNYNMSLKLVKYF